MQQALTALTDWAREWQLGISIDKCCVLNLVLRLLINNCELNVVLQASDLGILVSDSLSPTAHVCDIVSKAHRRANLYCIHSPRRILDCYSVHTLFMLDHLLNIILLFGHHAQSRTLKRSSAFSVGLLKIFEAIVATRTQKDCVV